MNLPVFDVVVPQSGITVALRQRSKLSLKPDTAGFAFFEVICSTSS